MNKNFHHNTLKKTLWENYLCGDKNAFGELYYVFFKKLTMYCLGRLKDITLAENATSEALEKLFRNTKPEEIRDVEVWLYTVARNICNTYWSKKNRQEAILTTRSYIFEQNRSPTIEDKLSYEDKDRIMMTVLNEQEYEIWELHQQGYNNIEIGNKLALSEKRIANVKSKVRTKLRKVFKTCS